MKNSTGISLTRVSGAENTFFIADLFDSETAKNLAVWSSEKKATFAKNLCTGFFGLQTDGVLFLRPEKSYDFAWDFFNADGSSAEMCGNAARCATVYFHEFIEKKNKVRFHTLAGDICGEFLSREKARVEMTKISAIDPHLQLEGEDGFFVNTGVPHFVLSKKPQKNLAQKLRFHPHFGSAGSNITFVEDLSSTEANAVTFERGVEDFTQACGTGAVAAAALMAYRNKDENNFRIQMPGGLLEVQNAKANEKPLLTGPVQIELMIKTFGDLL